MSFAPMQKSGMADLNDIVVFVRVAQFESFSRAAHILIHEKKLSSTADS
jgi:hypothetical protein